MNLSSRVTKLNNANENTEGRYVLYWMQMFKRASHNYALNFAIQMANERRLPLVVYEGLTYNYPWASDRFHTFVLEGVEEKQTEFAERGSRYIFYLQRNNRDPKNTVARLAKDAALLVTDDYPCFIIPEHNGRIAQLDLPVYAVDAGRDPNSYAGILWCFGKHDRPWFDREIFGTLRYMTSQSMAKKFRAKEYISRRYHS